MQYTVILNPAARKGAAGRRRAALEQAFREAGLEARWLVTRRPGEAVVLAQEAAPKAGCLVAVGGDGTLHEVGKGLIASGAETPLGLIPLGTGNDYARALGLPADPFRAVEVLATGHTVPVDYGRLRWRQGAVWHEDVFLNAMGLGFDARVADEARTGQSGPAPLVYLRAILRALRGRVMPAACLREGTIEKPGPVRYEGALLFVTAGNGVSSGGGIRLTPAARIDDGLLDVLVVRAASLWRILSVLPRAFRGRHLTAPEVQLVRLTDFHLQCAEPLPLHADGEILTRQASSLEASVIPGGLQVIIPSSPS